MSNPYYEPEEFGVETIAEFDLAEPNYSFDIVLVQRDVVSGLFYVNNDSGCSCPSPFENIVDRSALGKPLDAHEARAAILALVQERGDPDYRPDYLPAISAVMASPKVVRP